MSHGVFSGQAGPGALSSAPVSKVEIRVKCQNLLDKDVLSKSDPMCCLYQNVQGSWREIGRTENIQNSLSPQFAKTFLVDYYFEEVQKLRFAVYDIDNTTATVSDDDFLGQMECTLAQVVANTPYTKQLLLEKGQKAGNGQITASAEEMSASKECLILHFRATDLDKKDFFGKSDPFLEFYKQTTWGSWDLVHRTEFIKNTLHPTWKKFQINMATLCSGEPNRPLKVLCHDYDDDGSHDLIGEFKTTAAEMEQAAQKQVQWECINEKKKAKKRNYKNSGVIYLTSCQKVREYSFLDFIFGGLQMNFTVGIDFTASNGDPLKPGTLHFINPNQPNEYEQATWSVGQVIQDYDSDKMFPALGFGARIPPEGRVSHEFALNFNPTNPFCAGIEGVLQAYRNCIRQVRLYGPTNIAPIILHAAKFAAAVQTQPTASQYFVLLILSDGVITDMNDTRNAIVYASSLPLSIIIVGVGNADFTDMNTLDGDDGILRTTSGQPVLRDIVQFVPYRKYSSNAAFLAKEVLAEVPNQVAGYYKMKGIVPMTPPPAQQQPAG
ncbi:PREDICTED: copine-3-like [Priapulus caudatus]|uniref:Copine-3-like n=1 Tax=Priapulus caudatus TaxID=37621 RepID=A0ABM1EGX1_PRICU|nr:PREDICTED: copine-3-like [Priapulus caudatus]